VCVFVLWAMLPEIKMLVHSMLVSEFSGLGSRTITGTQLTRKSVESMDVIMKTCITCWQLTKTVGLLLIQT